MTQLPWTERVTMLSIHPDAATRDDVARLATELMEANRKLARVLDGRTHDAMPETGKEQS